MAKFLNKKGCGQVQANGFPLNHIKLFITPKQTIRLSEGPFRGSTCTVFLPALSQYENCACDEDRSGLKMADWPQGTQQQLPNLKETIIINNH